MRFKVVSDSYVLRSQLLITDIMNFDSSVVVSTTCSLTLIANLFIHISDRVWIIENDQRFLQIKIF